LTQSKARITFPISRQ